MSATKARRLVVLAIISAGVVLIVALVFVLLRATRSDVGRVRRLPDGSTLQLKRVALITTNYLFSYETGNPVSRYIGRTLPFRNPWKSWSSGTLGFSTRGET